MGQSRLARLLAHLLLDIDIASRSFKILVMRISRDTQETLIDNLVWSWVKFEILWVVEMKRGFKRWGYSLWDIG